MTPTDRARPIASTSSIKIIEGALFFAVSKRLRTRAAPIPTSISINSLPAIEKKGTPASPATALARSVLPTPEGPTKRAPFGIFAPRARYFSGRFKKSTTSVSSCFASSTPATSINFVVGLSRLNCFALLLENERILSPALRAWRRKKKKKPARSRIGRKIFKRPKIYSLGEVSLGKYLTLVISILAAFRVSLKISPSCNLDLITLPFLSLASTFKPSTVTESRLSFFISDKILEIGSSLTLPLG